MGCLANSGKGVPLFVPCWGESGAVGQKTPDFVDVENPLLSAIGTHLHPVKALSKASTCRYLFHFKSDGTGSLCPRHLNWLRAIHFCAIDRLYELPAVQYTSLVWPVCGLRGIRELRSLADSYGYGYSFVWDWHSC